MQSILRSKMQFDSEEWIIEAPDQLFGLSESVTRALESANTLSDGNHTTAQSRHNLKLLNFASLGPNPSGLRTPLSRALDWSNLAETPILTKFGQTFVGQIRPVGVGQMRSRPPATKGFRFKGRFKKEREGGGEGEGEVKPNPFGWNPFLNPWEWVCLYECNLVRDVGGFEQMRFYPLMTCWLFGSSLFLLVFFPK